MDDGLDALLEMATSNQFATDYSLRVERRPGQEPEQAGTGGGGARPRQIRVESARGEIRLLRRAKLSSLARGAGGDGGSGRQRQRLTTRAGGGRACSRAAAVAAPSAVFLQVGMFYFFTSGRMQRENPQSLPCRDRASAARAGAGGPGSRTSAPRSASRSRRSTCAWTCAICRRRRCGVPACRSRRHKRQFHAPGKLNTATSPARETAPDRLPELQQLWDSAGERAQRASSGRVTISNGSTGVYPGDPVVDVSPNYIVYGVNGNSTTHTTFTVYDKTGTKLAGPTAMSPLAPSGDGCRTSQSDPIVLFDRLAGRWFLLEMGGTSSAPKMCIYISKSENPVSGGWWFYGFSTPTTNDYPHCGVWNNAYVCSDNEGGSTVTFYAYDRANMLLGNTARARSASPACPRWAATVPGADAGQLHGRRQPRTASRRAADPRAPPR